jgi:hypothetical protein
VRVWFIRRTPHLLLFLRIFFFFLLLLEKVLEALIGFLIAL